jgi:hypothetical protein
MLIFADIFCKIATEKEGIYIMADIAGLQNYLKKIQRALDNADFKIFKYRFVKRNRIDDLLVCTLALLPDSFKEASKRNLNFDMYPSVVCYNQLSKILKKQISIFTKYYIVNYKESTTMIKNINKNISRDIKRLEGIE